jgi:hypothetical protein
MSADEKLVVMRLLMAIDDFRQPVRFKLGLPPKFDEFGTKLADADEVLAARSEALDAAMAAARALAETAA